MRWIALCGVMLLVGCVTERQITISARPADAIITIDGTDRGHGPIAENFQFHGDDVHHVTATRLGYASSTIDLTKGYDQPDLLIQLEPQKKTLTVHVTPVPAEISVDDKSVTPDGPVSDTTIVLPFTVDAQNQWSQHTITAKRPGFQTAEQTVHWDDPASEYTLNLDTMRKDLTITTTPPGAQVSIGGQVLGTSPVTAKAFAFPADPRTGSFLPQRLAVVKPGYDPVQQTISWDEGKRDYHLDLVPKSKTVHIQTSPPGALVKIDRQEIHSDENGIATATLPFPPVDDRGDLKTYEVVISKKTAETEWIPEELTIAWDNGKTDYSVTLQEVKTRPVALIRPKPVRGDEGWQIVPEPVDTLAMKDVTEGPAVEPPVRITDLPKGSVIGSLAISPDGQLLLFTVITESGKHELRSQMQLVHADGTGAASILDDGKTLDITPSFSPDGTQILFSSNRGGRHMSIWQLAATGEGGVTQLTNGDTTDLWPVLDSSPKARLYYEALVDSRPDPRLYMTQIGTTLRTDLTQTGGTQPRVSPKADAVLFTMLNEKTGKREIYKISDRGGGAVNLTNDPDFDYFDPVWSKDGNKIAFASDRLADGDGRHNFDIYTLDLLHPDKPARITTNGSWDDNPVFDPGGRYIYFRSNRGGNWAIWRVSLPK